MFLSLTCCGMAWHAEACQGWGWCGSQPPWPTALLTVKLELGRQLGHQAQPGLGQLDAQLEEGGREKREDSEGRRQASQAAGRQANSRH
jgi:hypothetical protein